MGLKGHHTELEHSVPLVFQPGVALQTIVHALGMLAILSRIGQTEVLYLFTKRGAIVPPIVTGARHGGGQHAQVGL